MAIGLTPRHTEEYALNELNREQFLMIALKTCSSLSWEVSFVNLSGMIAYTDNSAFSSNAEISILLSDDRANITSSSTGSEMMDWGKNKKTIKKFLEKFESIKSSVDLNELGHEFEELKTQFSPEEESKESLIMTSNREQLKSFGSLFIPSKDFFMTPILIDLNVLIFILMVVSGVNVFEPDSDSLLKWGANFRPMTLEGQWWRLLTNCFLHIGIFHLFMNMFALLYIGSLLEPLLGKTRFLLAYLLTGILASVASLWWHELTVSAGASGAIFGMYGVFLALLTTNLIEENARKSLLTSIAVFVGYNLLYGMKGGIDNAAHIGGLISGLIIGYAFVPSLKQPFADKLKNGTMLALSISLLAIATVVLIQLPNDIGKYDEKMKEFVALEEKAIEVYHLPENTPNDVILNKLQNDGITNWNRILKMLDELDQLELPQEIDDRNQLLREYAQLRVKCYELIYKSIQEDTDKYQVQIDDYNRQIEEKIAQLK